MEAPTHQTMWSLARWGGRASWQRRVVLLCGRPGRRRRRRKAAVVGGAKYASWLLPRASFNGPPLSQPSAHPAAAPVHTLLPQPPSEVTVAFKGISCWVPKLAAPASAFSRKGLASLVGLGGAKAADGAQAKSEMRQARGGLRVHSWPGPEQG